MNCLQALGVSNASEVNGSLLSSQQGRTYLGCLSSESFKTRTLIVWYLACLFIVGVVGNVLVIWVYCHYRRLTANKVFVLVMGVMDLTTCMIGLPQQILSIRYAYDTFNLFFCRVMFTCVTLPTVSSNVVLVAIAVDRFHHVWWPLNSHLSPCWALLISLVLTVFMWALYGAFIPMYGIHTLPSPVPGLSVSMCWIYDTYKKTHYQDAYTNVVAATFYFSLSVMLASYLLIYANLWHQDRLLRSLYPHRHCDIRSSSKQESFAVDESEHSQYQFAADTCSLLCLCKLFKDCKKSNFVHDNSNSDAYKFIPCAGRRIQWSEIKVRLIPCTRKDSSCQVKQVSVAMEVVQFDSRQIPSGMKEAPCQSVQVEDVSSHIASIQAKKSEIDKERRMPSCHSLVTNIERACPADCTPPPATNSELQKEAYTSAEKILAQTDMPGQPCLSSSTSPHQEPSPVPLLREDTLELGTKNSPLNVSHKWDKLEDILVADKVEDIHIQEGTYQECEVDGGRDNLCSGDLSGGTVHATQNFTGTSEASASQNAARHKDKNNVSFSILRKLTSRASSMGSLYVWSRQRSRIRTLKSHTTRTMAVLTVCYILTWLPHTIIRRYHTSPINLCPQFTECWIQLDSLALRSFYINSAVNAFVYSFNDQIFRARLKRLLVKLLLRIISHFIETKARISQ